VNEEIKKINPDLDTIYQSDLENAEAYLRQTIQKDEVVVLMGAGDVFRIGQNLIHNS
jgi:UDP-N-acetylmuramate-alanine ligase